MFRSMFPRRQFVWGFWTAVFGSKMTSESDGRKNFLRWVSGCAYRLLYGFPVRSMAEQMRRVEQSSGYRLALFMRDLLPHPGEAPERCRRSSSSLLPLSPQQFSPTFVPRLAMDHRLIPRIHRPEESQSAQQSILRAHEQWAGELARDRLSGTDTDIVSTACCS